MPVEKRGLTFDMLQKWREGRGLAMSLETPEFDRACAERVVPEDEGRTADSFAVKSIGKPDAICVPEKYVVPSGQTS